MTHVAMALLVFAAAFSIDFAHARYVLALANGRIQRAASWGVVQWAAGSVAFVLAIKVGLWLLPFEAMGLFLGTIVGARRVGES